MKRFLTPGTGWLLASWLAACLAAAPAPAQEPGARGDLERARAGLPPDAVAAFDAILAQARAQGLPTEPLVDKALEGLAKRRPPQVILAVLRQLSGELAQAQALLAVRGRAAPADVAAVRDALSRGVPPAAVQRLASQARPGEPIAVAVHTLADLLQRGVPVDVALDVLSAWRARGGAAAELEELPAAVERLIRQGVLPEHAAAAVAAAIRAGRGASGALPLVRGAPPGTLRRPDRDRPPLPPGIGPPAGAGVRKPAPPVKKP